MNSQTKHFEVIGQETVMIAGMAVLCDVIEVPVEHTKELVSLVKKPRKGVVYNPPARLFVRRFGDDILPMQTFTHLEHEIRAMQPSDARFYVPIADDSKLRIIHKYLSSLPAGPMPCRGSKAANSIAKLPDLLRALADNYQISLVNRPVALLRSIVGRGAVSESTVKRAIDPAKETAGVAPSATSGRQEKQVHPAIKKWDRYAKENGLLPFEQVIATYQGKEEEAREKLIAAIESNRPLDEIWQSHENHMKGKAA